MPQGRPSLRRLLLIAVGSAVVVVAALYLSQGPKPKPRPPATRPSVAASRPATRPAPSSPRSYMDLVLQRYPDLPTTQPLEKPLAIAYAGHIILNDPVCLDRLGNIWITHPDAEPTESLLPKARAQSIILTRERPVFVHWMTDEALDLFPHLVCLAPAGDGFELVGQLGRQPIGRGNDYDWQRAFSWDRRIVVPTRSGVSVFTIGNRPIESASPPLAGNEEHARVEIAFYNGPLAWIPPKGGHGGSAGAVRGVEDAWFPLTPESGWPAGLLHLVPLLDGSVLQLINTGADTVRLNVVSLERPQVDENEVGGLIDLLSDPDPAKRQKAFERLTLYGPALWPILEQRVDNEPPEAQARMRDLIKSRLVPRLGNMQLVGGQITVVSRFRDGGALFFAPRGVSVSRGGDEPQVVTPAWLSIRPQQPVRLLADDLVHDLHPLRSTLQACGADDWIVGDGVGGLRLYMGGGSFTPLLREADREFDQFIGVARGNRLIFRNSRGDGPSSQPTTGPANGPTLIIDPSLPDPTPRLPVWLLDYPTGTTGWDKDGWPAAKDQGAWALLTRDWRPLDEQKERFYSTSQDVPALPAPPRPLALKQPATTQATPASGAATAPMDVPFHVDSDGTYYYGGRSYLTLSKPDGAVVRWALPDRAIGEADPQLVRTKDGRLYLFNQPGRLLRIKPLSAAAEPFELEAVFGRRIPNSAGLTRMWLDPAGRIAMVYEGNKLAILFPQGYVPLETMNMIPGAEHDEMMKE